MAAIKTRGTTRSPGGYEETVTRTRRPITDPLQDRLKSKVNLRLRQHDRMDLTSFVRAAFAIDEIDTIQVERILPNLEHFKVGVMLKEHALEQGDLEAWVLTNYKGAGKFVFKPTCQGVWVGPQKIVRLGTGENNAGYDDGAEDADTMVAKALKRESNLSTIRQLREMNNPAAPKGEEEMKPGEIIELIKLGQGMNGGSSEVAQLRAELAMMRDAPKPTMFSGIEPLIPLLTPLLGGVSKGLLSRIVLSLLPQREPAPMPDPPPSLMDTARSIMEHPMVSAAISQLMPLLMTKLNAMPTAPAAPAPTPDAPQLEGVTRVPTFSTTDPDVKEMVDFIVSAISERRFPDALSGFQAFPELASSFIGNIMPDLNPVPFVMRLRTLDDKLREQRDNLRDFVEYVQGQIATMLEAQNEPDPPPRKPRVVKSAEAANDGA